MDDLAALAKVPTEVKEYIELIEGDVKTAEAEVTELTKALEEAKAASEVDPDPVEETDPIVKALSEVSDEAAAIFKAQADRLDAAEAKIQAQEDKEADAEWITKAAAFDGVIDNPAEFGPKLRAVADVDPELAETIASVLGTAGSRVEKSLFGELGSVAALAITGDAETKIVQLAKSLQEKDTELTVEAARAEAWTQNPELYEQHQAEMRERAQNA